VLLVAAPKVLDVMGTLLLLPHEHTIAATMTRVRSKLLNLWLGDVPNAVSVSCALWCRRLIPCLAATPSSGRAGGERDSRGKRVAGGWKFGAEEVGICQVAAFFTSAYWVEVRAHGHRLARMLRQSS
jgi:hypothetical protein